MDPHPDHADVPLTDPGLGERLAGVRRAARADGLDTLVFTPGDDLRYLLGAPLHSHERLTALVVPVGGEVSPLVVLPALERTAVAETAAAVVGADTATWADGEDAVALVAASCGARVAVSASAPARHVLALQERVGRRLQLASSVIDPVRAVKSTWELDRLADAARRIDAVHARMGEFVAAGRTERAAADSIAAAIVEEGLTHPEFVIVASGPNGADPHHEVSDRVMQAGDVVVIDIGGPEPAGYHSDCTRTYVLGEPAPDVAREYAILAEAQRLAREAVRPGVSAGEVDAAARRHLESAGLGELFVHRTGHGVGLGLHEPPFAAPGEATVLEPGMVLTVEPGIYRRGYWGARLEDVVVVTDEGGRALNTGDRTLRVL